jgi:hypothetical protein
LDFDDFAKKFLEVGESGARENLGARLEKKRFFPPNYFNAIESVPLQKCSNNVTKLATSGSVVENRHN